MGDNFSRNWGSRNGFGMIQAHYIQPYLMLCSLVPNRFRLVQVHGRRLGIPALGNLTDETTVVKKKSHLSFTPNFHVCTVKR